MAGILRGVASVPHSARSQHKNVSSMARKAGATEFSGASGIEACDAEFWLVKLMRVFEELEFTTAEKFRCATALLQDEAYQWWSSVIPHVPTATLDWEYFHTSFKAKYIGPAYYEQRRREFVNLSQGSMSVKEYEHEFTRLSTYAPKMVSTETMMCEKYLYGLEKSLYLAVVGFGDTKFCDLRARVNRLDAARGRLDISNSRVPPPSSNTFRKPSGSHHASASLHRPRDVPQFKKSDSHRSSASQSVTRPQRSTPASGASSGGSVQRPSYPLCPTCSRHHYGECWRAIGACFACGSKEHSIRDCPKSRFNSAASAPPPVPAQSDSRKPSGSDARSAVMVPARTYAIRATKERDTPNTGTGMTYNYNICLYVYVYPNMRLNLFFTIYIPP
jgi:hypothetical protein